MYKTLPKNVISFFPHFPHFEIFSLIDANSIREVCKKSKWKFKMAFAMKGGGSRGGLECHLPILKNDFC